jgi:hypothetical protein
VKGHPVGVEVVPWASSAHAIAVSMQTVPRLNLVLQKGKTKVKAKAKVMVKVKVLVKV